MPLKIELHDSEIESVTKEHYDIVLHFSSFVVLNVTDEFGFEFDKTLYCRGNIKILNAEYDNLPMAGDISSGYVGYKEWTYNLLPTNLSLSGSIVLFIQQGDVAYKIFGNGIVISTTDL